MKRNYFTVMVLALFWTSPVISGDHFEARVPEPLPFAALDRGLKATILTESEAKSLYDKFAQRSDLGLELSPEEGCEWRSTIIAYDLEKIGITAFKTLILPNHAPNGSGWLKLRTKRGFRGYVSFVNFHMAATVLVENSVHQIQAFVIDPILFDDPLSGRPVPVNALQHLWALDMSDGRLPRVESISRYRVFVRPSLYGSFNSDTWLEGGEEDSLHPPEEWGDSISNAKRQLKMLILKAAADRIPSNEVLTTMPEEHFVEAFQKYLSVVPRASGVPDVVLDARFLSDFTNHFWNQVLGYNEKRARTTAIHNVPQFAIAVLETLRDARQLNALGNILGRDEMLLAVEKLGRQSEPETKLDQAQEIVGRVVQHARLISHFSIRSSKLEFKGKVRLVKLNTGDHSIEVEVTVPQLPQTGYPDFFDDQTNWNLLFRKRMWKALAMELPGDEPPSAGLP